MLTHKQRIIQSIKRDELDRFPTQLTFTPEMSKIVAGHLKVSENELRRNKIRSLGYWMGHQANRRISHKSQAFRKISYTQGL